jgi:hypothetical protein
MINVKNNIHNIYKMKLLNNLIPKQLTSIINNLNNQHNILAIVFVLLIVLVVQYPAIFSKSINTVFGKSIILLIILLLTNYNTLVGLAATIVVVVFYVYLFDTGYEGFVENMEETPKPTITEKNGKPTISQPSLVETSNNGLINIDQNSEPKIPAISTPDTSGPTQVDLMLAAKEATMSEDSKKLPIIKTQNADVMSSEPVGVPKTTADNATLKPSLTNKNV